MNIRRVLQEREVFALPMKLPNKAYSMVLEDITHAVQVQQHLAVLIPTGDVLQQLQCLCDHHLVIAPAAEIVADRLPNGVHGVVVTAEPDLREEGVVSLRRSNRGPLHSRGEEWHCRPDRRTLG